LAKSFRITSIVKKTPASGMPKAADGARRDEGLHVLRRRAEEAAERGSDGRADLDDGTLEARRAA
jgi:hypothetical protein